MEVDPRFRGNPQRRLHRARTAAAGVALVTAGCTAGGTRAVEPAPTSFHVSVSRSTTTTRSRVDDLLTSLRSLRTSSRAQDLLSFESLPPFASLASLGSRSSLASLYFDPVITEPSVAPPVSALADGAVAPLPTPEPAACPPEMVLVDGDSCADVTHKCLRYQPDDPSHRCLEYDTNGDVCVPPVSHKRYCMDRYEWPGTPGAKPQVMVSYFEAERACKSVGKRMCDEDEFYLACEGPKHYPFAWGHVRHPSPCNIDRPYFLVDWEKWSHGGAVEEARRLDQALPVGASHCWSPYGVHDIAGNVDEWTHAREGREFEGSLNGGYWGPVPNACRYVTTVHGPEFSFYQIGFRCCGEASAKKEPAK